jgi:acyl phosphate:glycerol-3-phosphate acyltransferase
MCMCIQTFLAFLTSYIIGAIPTGFLIARAYGVQDIRRHGSGNIGATNVARVLGPRFFALIFVLDVAKAFLNIFVLQYCGYSENIILIAALMLLIGNAYSIFLDWSGGKGVASLFGILLALQWSVLPFAFIVWVCAFLQTRTVGIASVVAVLALPLIAWLLGSSLSFLLFCICASIWVILRHTANIKQFFS